MKTQAISAMLLAVMASPGMGQPPLTTKAQDPWVGTWTAMPGPHGTPENTLIMKDGDGYRLERIPYRGFRFKEVSPGVLECEHLGKIRRGKLTMTGVSGETVVFHAEFCYEGFYLFYCGPAPPK